MFSHLFSYLSEYFNNFLGAGNEVCSELSLPGNNKRTESSIKRYRLVAKLKSHKGPINTFSFNSNGTLLASGGDDEAVQIWDLQEFHPYQTLADCSHAWGQITCVRFLVELPSSMGELLCFRTGCGYILLYQRKRKVGN
jgi:WD40 repeat protein